MTLSSYSTVLKVSLLAVSFAIAFVTILGGSDVKPQKFRVWTNNQFEPEVLDVKKPKELCVPSIKTVL